MKMLGTQIDPSTSPLMKDLHDLGVKYGQTFVVVVRPIGGASNEQQGLLIDASDTSIKDVYTRWLLAGIYLLQATGAIEEYIEARDKKGPAPAETP